MGASQDGGERADSGNRPWDFGFANWFWAIPGIGCSQFKVHMRIGVLPNRIKSWEEEQQRCRQFLVRVWLGFSDQVVYNRPIVSAVLMREIRPP